MRSHLYEFRAETKKLKCSCGWEKTIKTDEVPSIQKTFAVHRAEMALPK